MFNSSTTRGRWPSEERTILPAAADAGLGATGLARWFAEEIQPHEPRLRAWLRASFTSLRDIDDVVQEAYLKVLRARGAGRIDHPKAYLFNTARNAALDRVRRDRIISFERLTDLETSFVFGDDGSLRSTAELEFELELLAAAVQALPSRCREVLVLRKYHGLSHEEIAARLGITRNTVNAQITAAMIRCRQYFRDHGLLGEKGHEK